ncbi:hypothetical protein J437_LFUL008344 [Ladona fulva]|uniref:Tc1-like transposase DDE domain-containing protein n=1 Tax=Ladona fulva TaxID=123851 RepID=A0A8K0K6L0_LADFU|nr:hypothetical protein J437_LFUL008344 [Ladona fulva]
MTPAAALENNNYCNHLGTYKHPYELGLAAAEVDAFDASEGVDVGGRTGASGLVVDSETKHQAQLAGLSTGLKIPRGRGLRFVILHAGSARGFVKGAKLVYLAKKRSGDYHDEMVSRQIEEWFKSQLLPNIAEGSIIVMDNATYHSMNREQIPTSSNNKLDMENWLKSKDIAYPERSLKIELLRIINSVREKYTSYEVDELAKERNTIVCLISSISL